MGWVFLFSLFPLNSFRRGVVCFGWLDFHWLVGEEEEKLGERRSG